ncbi:MAG: LPS-assembly protein LptD [Arcobacter sp.]|nr:LPS-assembly protein LptD [Arcobacter sp.]
MQINADQIEQNGTIITATGNILVFSPNYFITANKAIYDKNITTMELFGNVNISKNKETVSLTNYAFLDMKNEIDNATPILLIDKKTNVWINAKTIDKTSDLNVIKNATLSSCDCTNPTWSIGFSSGDYNTTDQWINTYNNTLYIHDIPAWYFLIPAVPYVTVPSIVTAYLILKMPYMGFSTNKERRSGLLKPQFGFGQEDGFLYAQPIYYAPRKDIDFEYIPQIRTLRGNGHEFQMRYADSAYSTLEFASGIFTEKDSYFKEKNLLNQNHYGGVLKYDRKKLFSNSDSSDGFYAFLQTMNDVEYLNTKYNSDNNIINADKILESKVKYFYNTPSYNTFVEALNYNDISKTNNDDVMQVTPSIGVHQYSTSLFFDKLRSSIDFKYKRQHRVVGLGADTYDLSIPFSYSKYFFDDYLLFNYAKAIDLHLINYSNDTIDTKENGTLVSAKDTVSLEIDLLKPYETKVHTLNLKLRYANPHHLSEKGLLYR